MAFTIRHFFKGIRGNKKTDAIILTVYFVAVFTFALLGKPGAVLAHILLFVLPGLYLVLRYWRLNYHAFLFSLVAGFLVGFPVQGIAELNQMWDYPHSFFDFFQYAGLRMLPVAWFVVWIGLSISVYSVFFDEHAHPVPRHHRFWKNHYKFLLFSAAVLAATAFALSIYPTLFVMNYPYVVFGAVFFFFPTALIFFLHPHLLRDVLKASIFLSLCMLVYEIVGLHVGWWTYPGEYLAVVNILGEGVPIEELIFWIGIGSLWAITAYEEIEEA